MPWPRAHWLVGLLTLAAFLAAGVYMRDVAKVYDLDDAPRLVYRSRFIFLLLISVANLALSSTNPKTWPARLASAFLLDPARGTHGSQLSGYTLRAVFAAALLLAFAYRKGRE